MNAVVAELATAHPPEFAWAFADPDLPFRHTLG